MNTTTRALIAGFLFLSVFASGIWLSRTGRPLNVAISTIHKLISLAAGIYVLVTVIQRQRMLPLSGAEWIATVVTGICFLGTVASGGFLSSDKPMPVALLRTHQIVPVLTAFSSAATLYLLLGH